MKALLVEIESGQWERWHPREDMAQLSWDKWKLPVRYQDKRKIYTEDEAIISANPAQLVISADGIPSVDIQWTTNLMTPNDILVRHQRRLAEQLDAELAKEIPDAVVAIKLQRALDTSKSLTDTELYQVAFGSLQYAEIEKPVIAEKLNIKISGLK